MSKLFRQKINLLYFLSIIVLFLYSFTQIDLGLALTRFPFLFSIQRAFQWIGYFNRPLSTDFYVALLVLLYLCFFVLLRQVAQHKLQRKTFWQLVIFTAVLLTFAYNAFSYDLFNYIFDAKIFTFYHQNPYLHKALDFPGDPMLGFMHWTHRTYPYGPVWLGISIPLSFLGVHIFLITFILFKALAAVSYVGSVYFIEKIMEKIDEKHALFAAAFFAFNPLVIIEALISAHNDIIMMVLALAGLYFLVHKKYVPMVLLFLLSIGTKYATVFLTPIVLALITLRAVREQVQWKLFLGTAIACLSIAVVAAAQQSGNFQPWYLLFILPFTAFLADNPYFFYGTSVVTLGALLTYVPFLYLGNWDKPVPDLLSKLYITTGIFTVVVFVVILIWNKKFRKQ